MCVYRVCTYNDDFNLPQSWSGHSMPAMTHSSSTSAASATRFLAVTARFRYMSVHTQVSSSEIRVCRWFVLVSMYSNSRTNAKCASRVYHYHHMPLYNVAGLQVSPLEYCIGDRWISWDGTGMRPLPLLTGSQDVYTGLECAPQATLLHNPLTSYE